MGKDASWVEASEGRVSSQGLVGKESEAEGEEEGKVTQTHCPFLCLLVLPRISGIFFCDYPCCSL